MKKGEFRKENKKTTFLSPLFFSLIKDCKLNQRNSSSSNESLQINFYLHFPEICLPTFRQFIQLQESENDKKPNESLHLKDESRQKKLKLKKS
jgi:hypothetical protein